MIKLRNYNQNSAQNANAVKIGDVTFYFSYETIVGFYYNGQYFVSENIRSRTTGKHLNRIDGGDKANRLKHSDFIEKLNAIKVTVDF